MAKPQTTTSTEMWAAHDEWIALPDEGGVSNRRVNVRNESIAADLVRIHNAAILVLEQSHKNCVKQETHAFAVRYAEQAHAREQVLREALAKLPRQYRHWNGASDGWIRGRDLDAALASFSETSGAKPDVRAIVEALGFDPTNHHNAAACPYCTPKKAVSETSGAKETP